MKTPMNDGTDAEPGDLMALRVCLWEAVQTARGLLRSRTNDTKLRAIHALAQSGNAYRSLLEDSDFDARLTATEEQIERVKMERTQDRERGIFS